MSPVLRFVLHALGIGVLVAGGALVAAAAAAGALLFAPFVFWLAWNVLDLASAVGLPELGFWGIFLAALFLVVAWFGKVVVAAFVFLIDPSWFDGAAQVHWPAVTLRNFLAVALLALIASRPHAQANKTERRHRRS